MSSNVKFTDEQLAALCEMVPPFDDEVNMKYSRDTIESMTQEQEAINDVLTAYFSESGIQILPPFIQGLLKCDDRGAPWNSEGAPDDTFNRKSKAPEDSSEKPMVPSTSSHPAADALFSKVFPEGMPNTKVPDAPRKSRKTSIKASTEPSGTAPPSRRTSIPNPGGPSQAPRINDPFNPAYQQLSAEDEQKLRLAKVKAERLAAEKATALAQARAATARSLETARGGIRGALIGTSEENKMAERLSRVSLVDPPQTASQVTHPFPHPYSSTPATLLPARAASTPGAHVQTSHAASNMFEVDAGKISKALDLSKAEKFNGTSSMDARQWATRTYNQMYLRKCDPAIMHQVAWLRLEGVAMSSFEEIIATEAQPDSWPDFVKWLVQKFPSTRTKSSVIADINNCKQRSNEPVTEYFDRFSKLSLDATDVKLSWEKKENFVNGLNKALKVHVQNELDRLEALGMEMSFDQCALCAITKDNRFQLEKKGKESLNHMEEKKDKKKKDKKRKADDLICYNCGGKGHIFGTIENPSCTKPVSEKTAEYFKKKKGNSGKASGSGESKE